jgi:hypothetical protein
MTEEKRSIVLTSGNVKETVDTCLATGNTYSVVFKKKDGTIRSMRVTTSLKEIPKELHPKGDKTPNPEAKNVWSIDDKGWRAFRYDSVISFVEVT